MNGPRQPAGDPSGSGLPTGGAWAFTAQRQALWARQQRLLLRSAQLRWQLQSDLAVLQAPLTLAERLQWAWHWLRARPLLPLSAALVLVVLRPRRAWRWGLRLWWGWRMLRRSGLLRHVVGRGDGVRS